MCPCIRPYDAAGAWGLGLAYLGMRGHVHASVNFRVCVLGAFHGSVKVLAPRVDISMTSFEAVTAQSESHSMVQSVGDQTG